MSDQSPEYKLALRIRTSRQQERRRAASRRSLPRVVLDAFKSGIYILLSFPLAIGYIVFFVTGISTGFGLLVVLAGFVILALVVFAATLAMRLERWLAIHLLSAQIPPLNLRKTRAGEAPARASGRSRSRAIISTLKDYLANASLWKGMALLLIKLPLIIAALVITLIPLSLTISFVLAPLLGQFVNSGWTVDLTSHGAWITSLMAIPSGIVTIGVFDGVGSVLRRTTTFFLSSPPRSDRLVRDSLAEGLGDESLTIAYWLPEREIFVDDEGHEVQISAATASGRVWTPVEHDGKLIAAIIHRPDLANTDIVHTAGTAAVLQLENERLRADLKARLDELRDSRARIVQVSDAERRRLERNLHDGAQQQLVALALQLRLARNKTTDEESAKLIDGALEQLDQALSELRELARGIHPAILSDRGLDAAVKALAERQPLPTEVEYAVKRKLDPSVEATAYFVVAEGLTNIGKYAGAELATVQVREQGEALEVEVKDDGCGGADASKGTGLHGLEERLRALDGTLSVESKPGEGTRLLARIPLHECAPDENGEPEADSEPADQE
ncbi:MAG TPA: sensor histidine kinase [Gaiellaceae bacterium]